MIPAAPGSSPPQGYYFRPSSNPNSFIHPFHHILPRPRQNQFCQLEEAPVQPQLCPEPWQFSCDGKPVVGPASRPSTDRLRCRCVLLT